MKASQAINELVRYIAKYGDKELTVLTSTNQFNEDDGKFADVKSSVLSISVVDGEFEIYTEEK